MKNRPKPCINLFEASLLPIQEIDFLETKLKLIDLKKKGITNFRDYLEDNPDFIEFSAKKTKIVNVNTAAMDLYGATTKKELLGTLYERLDHKSFQLFKEQIIAIAENKLYYEGESINTTMLGKSKHILIKMRLPVKKKLFKSVFVYIVDISKQTEITRELKMHKEHLEELVKERTKALTKEKENFETLFEDNSDGMLLLQDKKFVRCNRRIVKMLGYESKKKVLQTYPSDLSPEHQPDGSLSFEKQNEMIGICIDTGFHKFEWVHKKADGTNFWAEVTLNLININNKNTIYVKWRDIDNEKQLKMENEQNIKELLKSEKMAGLGNMVAGIAHEINTLVGLALTGNTHLSDKTRELEQLFKDNKMSESDFTEYLNNSLNLIQSILNSLRKAIGLIKSFKQVAVDQSSNENREFELNEYIHEISMSLQNAIKKSNHKITIDIDKKITLNSNPGAFSQIVTNLVMNSLIHGFKNLESREIIISAKEEGKKLHLNYQDNGVGMNDEIKQKIFDPFYTTNRAGGGSGLGMHIVYNLVLKKLNGTIKVISEPGKGVRFDIVIPMKSDGKNDKEPV